MQTRMIASLMALMILSSSTLLMAQTKKTSAAVQSGASGRVEPLRSINGKMQGSTVRGRFKQSARTTDFSFKIRKADMVGGQLRLTGDFALGGPRAQAGDQVTATIAGVMSYAVNPWPGPRYERQKRAKEEEKKAGEQQQGREAKSPEAAGQLGQLAQSTQDTARKTPPAPGEKTEQTQSLYAQAETATGCGVMFLNITLPQRLRARMGRVAEPLQLGIVLSSFDNERGEEINREVCRLLKPQESRAQSASLSQLNRLLDSSN